MTTTTTTPDSLWRLDNGFEVRYYTTPRTVALAIVNGYLAKGGQLVRYGITAGGGDVTQEAQALASEMRHADPRGNRLRRGKNPEREMWVERLVEVLAP